MSSSNAGALIESQGRTYSRPGRFERLFIAALENLQQGQLTVNLPSGRSLVVRGRDEKDGESRYNAVWDLKSLRALRRMIRHNSIGFAEAYMAGEWDSPDLTRFLELMCGSLDELQSHAGDWRIVRLWNRWQHLRRGNTRRGSKKNIAYHYDLGNAFYREWLDQSMTYSSALFDDEHNDLSAAQVNKYRKIAEDLGLAANHEVLEIGCGWGGFAEFAAREYGCRIVCLTLSREQLEYARRRIRRACLTDRVEVRYQDYRDVTGHFDRIVSIEMFEAVGEEHWPTYFAQVRDRLKPAGMAGLQIITIDDERFEKYRSGTDFIQKYIFPGGMLPSPTKLSEHFSGAGLRETGRRMFGDSYARTLGVWQRQFNERWSTIADLGYSEGFRRMWNYYLSYCAAGFRRGMIDVGQFILEKNGSTAT